MGCVGARCSELRKEWGEWFELLSKGEEWKNGGNQV